MTGQIDYEVVRLILTRFCAKQPRSTRDIATLYSQMTAGHGAVNATAVTDGLRYWLDHRFVERLPGGAERDTLVARGVNDPHPLWIYWQLRTDHGHTTDSTD